MSTMTLHSAVSVIANEDAYSYMRLILDIMICTLVLLGPSALPVTKQSVKLYHP